MQYRVVRVVGKFLNRNLVLYQSLLYKIDTYIQIVMNWFHRTRIFGK